MTEARIQIADTELILDSDVAEHFVNLQSRWCVMRDNQLIYQADADARARYPELSGSRGYGVGSLVHFFTHGEIPADDLVYWTKNGVSGDYRRENLERITRAELARRKFGSERTPDGGITLQPSGRYRVRAFITGVGQVAVGTYDTIEQARAARDEAVAHPERYPSKKKASVGGASRVAPAGPVTTSASVAASLDEAIAGMEAILAKLRQERAAL